MNYLNLKRKMAHYWPANHHCHQIILLYHSVGHSPWGLSEEKFFDQLNWLADHAQLMSLNALLQSKQTTDLQIAITFDDGYASLYENVADKIHEKIKPMVYLNTGWIGENINQRKLSDATLGHYPDEYFLTWPQIIEMEQAGWEFGSHGVNHLNFSDMQENKIYTELVNSKSEIEKKLGKECLHFAYPWGRHSKLVKKVLNSTGYQFAAAARHGRVTPNSDPLELPRINISKEYSFHDFKEIIQGKWDFLKIIQKLRGM